MKTLAKTLHKIDKINLRLQTSDPQIKYLVDTFACEELQRVRRITVRDDRSEDTGKISLGRYQEIYESIETAADKLDSALQKLQPYIEGRNCVGSKLDSEAAARVWQVT